MESLRQFFIKPIRPYWVLAIFTVLLISCNTGKSPNKSKTEGANKEIQDAFYLKLADGQALIIPGVSIGKLKVGAESEEGLKWLKKPQKGHAGMCKSLGRWFYGDSTQKPRKELTVFSECDPDDDMKPHIKWIRTTDPAFKTQQNIGVNSAYADIRNIYPSLKLLGTFTHETSGMDMVLLSSQKGISFELEAGNGQALCKAVLVNPAGKELSMAYFPFYKNLKLSENNPKP